MITRAGVSIPSSPLCLADSSNLLDNHRVFNTGDHVDAAATLSAHLNIDVEDALEALRPSHGRATFGRRLVLRLIRRFGFVALTPFGGRHQRNGACS